MTQSGQHHEGRAEAVDIVLDAREDASLLRVEKLLREVPLSSMMERPNLITAGALREMASSLDSYVKPEREQLDLRNCSRSTIQASNEFSINSEDEERIFKHHMNQIKASLKTDVSQLSSNSVDTLAPLVSALRQCSTSAEVMQYIMRHPCIISYQKNFVVDTSALPSDIKGARKSDDSSSLISDSSFDRTRIELLVHEAIKDGTIEALLIAALALLAYGVTNLEEENKSTWECDVKLRVGTLMSLLPISSTDECLKWSEEENNKRNSAQFVEYDDVPLVIPSESLYLFSQEAINYEKAKENMYHSQDDTSIHGIRRGECILENEVSIANNISPIEVVEVNLANTQLSHEVIVENGTATNDSGIDVTESGSFVEENSSSLHISHEIQNSSDEESYREDMYGQPIGYDDDAMLRQALALSMVEDSIEDNGGSREISISSSFDKDLSDRPELDDNYSTEVVATKRGVHSLDYEPNCATIEMSAQKVECFGEVRICSVLIHILRSILCLIESSQKNVHTPGAHCENLLRGGIGSTLFRGPTQKSTKDYIPADTEYNINIIDHLLTAICILLADCRESVLESTIKSPAIGIMQAEDRNIKRDIDNEESNTKSVETGNDDDPAGVSIVNKDGDISLSRADLYSKGLHRKAAAAADAVALKQREDKKRFTFNLRNVKFLSLSSILTLKSMQHSHGSCNISSSLIGKKRKLLKSLEKLYSYFHSQSFRVVTSMNERLHMTLCNLAILVWADSIEVLFPTASERLDLIKSFIDYFQQHNCMALNDTGEITSIPWSEYQQRLVMFESLSSVCCSLTYLQTFFQDDIVTGGKLISNLFNILEYPVLSLKLPNATKLYYALISKVQSKLILNETEGTDWISHLANEGLEFGEGTVCFSGESILFDPSHCSDSVAVIKSDEGFHLSSVLQRASKKWGTVFSDKLFSSKSGIHRFAVRLDHCEKGHIFVGIATSQASTDSYVGSDRYGWGLIGTQALWHDRCKIRSDYGSPFRTGDIIIVSLNTNNGSLSFGILKDDEKSNIPLSGSHQYEDWGVAFEGLPLNTNFFPVVGLYQRDDKVTILDIVGSSPRFGQSNLPNMPSKYIDHSSSILVSVVSRILYNVLHALEISLVRENNVNSFVVNILSSLASSFCIMDEHDHVTFRLAWNIIPTVLKIWSHLERCTDDNVLINGVLGGSWSVRAMSPEGKNCEAYSLNIDKTCQGSNGSYSIAGNGKGEAGKSKDGSVKIFGVVEGTRFRFCEFWTKEPSTVTKNEVLLQSSCTVDARLNLNATAFEGKYISSGQSYPIAGIRNGGLHQKEATMSQCKSIVCLSLSHLSSFLMGHQMESCLSVVLEAKQSKEIAKWLESDLLMNGFMNDDLLLHANELKLSFSVDLGREHEIIDGEWWKNICDLINVYDSDKIQLPAISDDIDEWVSRFSGGNGVFGSLSDSNFRYARQLVATVLVHHSYNLQRVIDEFHHQDVPSDTLRAIWRKSINILECAVRQQCTQEGISSACREASRVVIAQSEFLLRIRCSRALSTEAIASFYHEVKCEQIDLLSSGLALISKKYLCKMIGLSCVRMCVRNNADKSRYECDALPSDSYLSLLPIILRNEKVAKKISRNNSIANICWKSEQNLFSEVILDMMKSLIQFKSPHLNLSSLRVTILTCLLCTFSPSIDSLGIVKDMIECFKNFLSCDSLAIADASVNKDSDICNLSNHYLSRKVLCVSLYATHIMMAQLLWYESEVKSIEYVFIQELLSLLKKQLLVVVDNAQRSEKISIEEEYRYFSSQDITCCYSESSTYKSYVDYKVELINNDDPEYHCLNSLLRSPRPLDVIQTNVSITKCSELFLSDMLTMVQTLLSTKVSRDIMVKTLWTDEFLLLAGVFKSSSKSTELSIVNRKKVLRLLKRCLYMEQPRSEVVEGLLSMCHYSEDCSFFARSSSYQLCSEAVDILRFLSIKSHRWNNLLLKVIRRTLLSIDASRMKLGVFSYLGGNLKSLSIGCHVLVESNTSKGKVFDMDDRIESIIRSISHRTCPAGVISNIDEATHSCEVVLFDNRTTSLTSDGYVSLSKTSPIAVRAVRVDLDDIALVNESSLIVETEHCLLLKDLSTMLGEMNIILNKPETSSIDMHTTIFRVLIFRAIGNILTSTSDDIWKSSDINSLLATILEIAAVKIDDSNLSLSSVATCEQLICRKISQLSDIEQRRKALAAHPPTLTRLESLIRTKKEKNNEDDINELVSGDDEDSISTSETNNESQQPSEDDIQAVVAQMAELGLPRAWAELALRRTGAVNIEAAVHYCLEHGGEMEQMIAEEELRGVRRSSGRSRPNSTSTHLIRQLREMGFPSHWCVEALNATRNNVDEALTWILTNGERLAQLDENERLGNEHDDDGDNDSEHEVEDDDDEDDNEGEFSSESSRDDLHENDSSDDTIEKSWYCPGPCPIQFVSGRSSINAETLEVSGLPTPVFSSVGTKGIIHTSGKWYYEVELLTAGCLQIGWADGSFAGHCQADRGDGVGDGPSSWAYDGWRRYKWHAVATEWGCRWQVGDIIGCAVDMDSYTISFTVNGKGEEIGMGTAFNGVGFRPCGGVYACVSFNRRERLKFHLGGGDQAGGSFKFGPPLGYRAVGEAVLQATREMSVFVDYENRYLDHDSQGATSVSPMCDFSDGEHGHELFAWQHRYYGSDASVHLTAGKDKSKTKDSTSAKNEQEVDVVINLCKKRMKEKNLTLTASNALEIINDCYMDAEGELKETLAIESKKLCVLYARKVILGVITCRGMNFDFTQLIRHSFQSKSDLITANKLWFVIDSCCSLRASGWVGEAGVMAVAAEALGLGISSNESPKCKKVPPSLYFTSALITDDPNETSNSLVASSELSLYGMNGIGLVFMKCGLQAACSRSLSFSKVLVAEIRKTVRSLSCVEVKEAAVEGEESSSSDVKQQLRDDDSRLILYLTGLLVSNFVKQRISPAEWNILVGDLVESWSIGLLSGSIPWRMICALTIAGLVNFISVDTLNYHLNRFSIIKRYYQRLPSTIARRMWAERAAIPISSRYVQALIELLSSLRNIGWNSFLPLRVDAATPVPLISSNALPWEEREGWLLSDSWKNWLGTVEYFPVDWEVPPRSTVRALMDEGEGPPMLREGCIVCRGIDWSHDDDDGRIGFELKKAQNKGKQDLEEDKSTTSSSIKSGSFEPPALPVGKVLSIEPWEGVPGMGRRVHWQLTGKEGVYCFGGDGGKFDICHVEMNKKGTKIRKKYPYPESLEQIMSRHGFGSRKKFNVLLRILDQGKTVDKYPEELDILRDGILEWPDLGAAVSVKCLFHSDGAMTIEEKSLLYGSKHNGWEIRFGEPDFVPGSTTVLAPTHAENFPSDRGENEGHSSIYEQLLGSSSHKVRYMKRKEDSKSLRIASEMRLWRRKSVDSRGDSIHLKNHLCAAPSLALTFDKEYHSHNISISQNGRIATCQSSNGRCIAFGSVGFSKGVHYWEVKLEQADIGSIFVGVAEKPAGSTMDTPKLSRWMGWGFVNFRATYTSGIERVYGSHTNNGDIIGVLLDCDAGRISFFYDGLKYGEHILNDLGVAFSNLSPFGFNADGCGGGGASQGAPSGLDGGTRSGRYPANGSVKARTLWPVIGFKNSENRVVFTGKWISNYGQSCIDTLGNVMKVDEAIRCYHNGTMNMPSWMQEEGFSEYNKWRKSNSIVVSSRGCSPIPLCTSNLDVNLDTSPYSCGLACALLGMRQVLLCGDKVEVKRCQGRILELPEVAEVLGTMNGRLFYRLTSQKSEGGSLVEGGGRAWFWDESEVMDDSLLILERKSSHNFEHVIPRLDRFTCYGHDLKVIYEKGALLRSDLEIDFSSSMGTIPVGTTISNIDILDCRMNSSGILRYKVKYNENIGWISKRIRGGSEQLIVERIPTDNDKIITSNNDVDIGLDPIPYAVVLPETAANIWFEKFSKHKVKNQASESLAFEDYRQLLSNGVFPNMNVLESDEVIVQIMNSIKAVSPHMNFEDVLYAFKAIFGSSSDKEEPSDKHRDIQEAILCSLPKLDNMPSIDSLMARISMLIAMNRRARQALVWLPAKSTQEGSCLFGGVIGYGASVDKIGRDILVDRHEWAEIGTFASRIRKTRRLLFTDVKHEFFSSVIGTTTTPTPISPDEYELPREIRTVHINRIKARRASAVASKKKYSIFSQLKHEMRSWNGAWLRRSYIAKGHGGQKRAFKVKLVGEGVNDYSGPYREVFSDAVNEVQEFFEGKSFLGILEPSPNAVDGLGDNRDLVIFKAPQNKESDDLYGAKYASPIANFFRSSIGGGDDATREVEDGLTFFGRIIGTACRHGIQLDLHLPFGLVWSKLSEDYEGFSSANDIMAEVDTLESKLCSDGLDSDAMNNRRQRFLNNQQRMLNSLADGMAGVLPIELFCLFTRDELKDLICGNTDVDVNLLMRMTEYEGGYSKDTTIIKYFWEILREMTSRNRKLFLQFVWARSCLPSTESDFEAPFKIIKDPRQKEAVVSTYLPTASTCFFSLTLPEYETKEILHEKLLFAIQNGYTMESDFVTNDAEVEKGWRD